jgi:hypothetical protein
LLCEKDALKNVAKILAQDPGKIPYVGAPIENGVLTIAGAAGGDVPILLIALQYIPKGTITMYNILTSKRQKCHYHLVCFDDSTALTCALFWLLSAMVVPAYVWLSICHRQTLTVMTVMTMYWGTFSSTSIQYCASALLFH